MTDPARTAALDAATSSAIMVPLRPCGDVDVIADFWTGLGLQVTYRQRRPNPYLGLELGGIALQYYGMPQWDPEQFPRVTRPRRRANNGGLSGFSLIDPAGNWVRVTRLPTPGDGPTTPDGDVTEWTGTPGAGPVMRLADLAAADLTPADRNVADVALTEARAVLPSA